MNVQRLIEKYKELWNEHSPFYEPVPYTSMVELFLKELKQLDEPRPVKVPQFVADVIEGAREQSPELEDALHYACSNGSHEFTEWYQKKSNRDLFARAWLDGYEVEKEKRYYVRFKWIEDSYSYLTLIKHLHAWTLKNITLDKKFRTAHTRKELEEAGFGEIFNSPLFEVVEVE